MTKSNQSPAPLAPTAHKRTFQLLAMKELLCPEFLVGRILYPMEFANPQKSRTFAPKLNDYGNGNKCYNTNSNF